jgi:hypothetical protein
MPKATSRRRSRVGLVFLLTARDAPTSTFWAGVHSICMSLSFSSLYMCPLIAVTFILSSCIPPLVKGCKASLPSHRPSDGDSLSCQSYRDHHDARCDVGSKPPPPSSCLIHSLSPNWTGIYYSPTGSIPYSKQSPQGLPKSEHIRLSVKLLLSYSLQTRVSHRFDTIFTFRRFS